MEEKPDQRRMYKGALITKWNPTNRFFTKGKGELISDKAVERSSIISTNNHFEALSQQVEEKDKDDGVSELNS